jgi:hypothetical protein
VEHESGRGSHGFAREAVEEEAGGRTHPCVRALDAGADASEGLDVCLGFIGQEDGQRGAAEYQGQELEEGRLAGAAPARPHAEHHVHDLGGARERQRSVRRRQRRELYLKLESNCSGSGGVKVE